ncbi:F420-dependent methylene-tetrahydromethanopterin reductase [Candidatus Entotheonella serta]|nr:F420-dependent methylene-tetrahydromethanopterin reductase [Candidatus Entotheonella serta]
MAMSVSIGVGGANSGRDRDFDERVTYVVEAERLGVDTVWTAEAWGQDAIAPLAFLAARTERIRLGTGIMQISARAPAMTAMTALTMAAISNDRFILGLGVSGPQVVEGLHNHPYQGPLTRLKETVDIIKLAFAGERLQYDGKYHQLPLPGGEGKALRLAQPGNSNIPIYLATIGPKALEYTGEVADGWLGTSFTPEHAEAHLSYLKTGAERTGRQLEQMDIQVGGAVAFGDDLATLIAPLKPRVAFTLGAMGSARTNFYNDAFRRGGWNEAAREVQQLWVAGQREEACARVPDAMVIQANLVGDESAVRDRIRAYKRADVTTLRLAPEGDTLDKRLETLGRAMELVRAVDAE